LKSIRDTLQQLKAPLGNLSKDALKELVQRSGMIKPSVDPEWYTPGLPDDLHKTRDFVPARAKNDMVAGWISYNIKY